MTKATELKPAPRIGLALGGGGPLGGIYEIGALRALDEALTVWISTISTFTLA